MPEFRVVDGDFTAALVRLQRVTFEQAYGDVHAVSDIRIYCEATYTERAARRALCSDRTVCCAAFVGVEPVGYYLMKISAVPDEREGNAAELKQIYVLKDHYGDGLARKLFEDARSRAANAGLRWLWLVVSRRNHRAEAFYRKLNFERVGDGPELIVGEDRLASSVLALDLSP